jgi:hypothetical protein
MINKLFGGKKSNSEYYLQIDETSDSQSTSNNNGTKATATVVEEPKAIAEKPKTEPVVVEEKKAEPAKATKKTSKKKTAAKAEAAPAAPAPKKAPAYEPPFWVQAIKNYSSNGNGKAAGSGESFADKYLMPNPSNYRRRPGPSLNPFMDMARQVNRSNSRI